MKLSEIRINPKNPRFIRNEMFQKLLESLKTFPKMMELRPIIVDEENVIQGGNMRYRALKELGYKDIPESWVKQGKDLTPEQWREFVVKDNLAYGEWDMDLLSAEYDMEEMIDWGLEIPDFAFKQEAVEDDYEIPDEIKTDIVLGDLFEIGQHRLLCGDSTDSEQVAKLMNGVKCNALITSPPYWNQRDYSHWDKFEDYIKDMQMVINSSMLESNAIVFWNVGDDSANHRHISAHHSVMIESCGLIYIDAIIWKKQGVTGIRLSHQKTKRLYYPGFSFENCLVFQKDNNSFPVFDERFVGDVPVTNVWEISTDPNNGKKHSAPFPVALPSTAMKCYTNDGRNVVYDPFLGSGTTMVAAHQLNRKCYGMEIDCKYCEVIVNRMLKLDNTLTIKRNGIDETDKWIKKLSA